MKKILVIEGSVSKAIRDRRATQPALFRLNPWGRAALAILGRCSPDPISLDTGLSSRLLKSSLCAGPLNQPETWWTSTSDAVARV